MLTRNIRLITEMRGTAMIDGRRVLVDADFSRHFWSVIPEPEPRRKPSGK